MQQAGLLARRIETFETVAAGRVVRNSEDVEHRRACDTPEERQRRKGYDFPHRASTGGGLGSMTEANEHLVRIPRWRWTLLRRMVRALFRLAARIDVSGQNQIPRAGGCVLVFNHLSNFDPPLLFAVIDYPRLTALMAAEYRQRRFHRFWLDAAGTLWIRRGASDRAALRQALAHLEHGWIVGIAPEGTRSRDHVLHAGKPGPAFLAAHAEAPVLPVGITGTESLGTNLKRLRRGTITVRFGEPFRVPATSSHSKQDLQAATDLLMCRVAALVPRTYRGVYADHPLLRDFESGSLDAHACASTVEA
jgi:1-acyl-sn-glycerol-3-phosphate acyltransferase